MDKLTVVEETGVPRENRPASSHWQTLSHNDISSTSCHERVSNKQRCGDRLWLHRYLSIQLPYNRDLYASGNIKIRNGKLFSIATFWLGY